MIRCQQRPPRTHYRRTILDLTQPPFDRARELHELERKKHAETWHRVIRRSSSVDWFGDSKGSRKRLWSGWGVGAAGDSRRSVLLCAKVGQKYLEQYRLVEPQEPVATIRPKDELATIPDNPRWVIELGQVLGGSLL